MANIPLADLNDDILDRMDNLVVFQKMPENIRSKLNAKKRVAKAMNQALVLFVRDANIGTIGQFIEVVPLVADTDIGPLGDGIANSVKAYIWPEASFEERSDGGIRKIILDDAEYTIASNNLPLDTVRYMANSPYYGTDYAAFNVDYENKRIYTPEAITIKARIVKYPESINEDQTYGTGSAAEIPVSDTFLQTLSEMGLQELIKMADSFPNRQQAIQDTANLETQQQGDQ